MNNENLSPLETSTSEQESDKVKVRAAIKKYSRQTKIYPPTEW